MKIKAERIYKQKNQEFDASTFFNQLAEGNRGAIGTLVEKFEESTSEKSLAKLSEYFKSYFKTYIDGLKIDKQQVKRELQNDLEAFGEKIIGWLNSHSHNEYLEKECKQELETMIQQIAKAIESKYKTLANALQSKVTVKQLDEVKEEVKNKAEKGHKHLEFDKITLEIGSLRGDVATKAEKDHSHKEYVTREEFAKQPQQIIPISGGARIFDSEVSPNVTRSSTEIAKHVFGEQNETSTYTGDLLTRVDYGDGSYKTITYQTVANMSVWDVITHVYKGKTVATTYTRESHTDANNRTYARCTSTSVVIS